MVQTGSLLVSLLHNAACTLNKQGSQVLIASLTDSQQFLFAPGGIFSRNDPHPGRQISPFSKGATVAYRSDQGRRSDRTNSWYLREPLAVLILFRCLMNNPIHLFDASCRLLQFHLELRQQNTKTTRQPQLGVFQNTRQQRIHMTPSLGQCESTFQKKTADLVDHCRTSHHPTLAHAM